MAYFTKLPFALILIITLSQNYNPTQAQVGWQEVFYEDILQLMQNPSALIVDVRTRCEVEESGLIPTAINIPLKELAVTLSLPAQDFYLKFQRRKPKRSNPIVFYCLSGDRSTEASNMAIGLSYTNVKNYKGGWLDWQLRMRIHHN